MTPAYIAPKIDPSRYAVMNEPVSYDYYGNSYEAIGYDCTTSTPLL